MLVWCVLSSVCLRLSQFYHISYVYYTGLCVFILPISSLMIVRICIINLVITMKSEEWTFSHCLGLGHETILCAASLAMFLNISPYHSRCNNICVNVHSIAWIFTLYVCTTQIDSTNSNTNTIGANMASGTGYVNNRWHSFKVLPWRPKSVDTLTQR